MAKSLGEGSGGFFGGFAQGQSDAASQQLEEEKQAALESNKTKALATSQIESTISHIQEVAKAAAANGNDPKKILEAVQPLIASAQGLAQAAGIDPNMIAQRAQLATMQPIPAADAKHSVVKIGSNLQGEQYGVLEQNSGAIKPIGGQPQLSQSEVIPPGQAQRVNPAGTPGVPPLATPAVAPAAAAAPDGTPAQTVAARFPSPEQGGQPAVPVQAAPAGPKLPPDMKPGDDAINFSVQNNVTGDEFLKALPHELRGLVKDIAEYRVDPKTLSVKGGRREQILGLASQYSGHTYDQKYYNSMAAAIKEFTSGGNTSPAGQMTAGNVAIQHLGTVAHGIDKLEAIPGLLDKIGKSGQPIVSYAANALKNKSIVGTSEGQALQAFLTARNRYSEEITKFYAGSQGSEAERKRSIDSLDAALSPGELYSTLNTEAELLNGKINVLQDRWKNALAGPRMMDATIRSAVPDFPILQEKSAKALDEISKGYFTRRYKAGGGSPPEAAPAVVDYRTFFGTK